ncbi:hypothetical protein TWF730_010157 [Orbilia blumenaviensis]|uniref:C2H2-type domain-containing protein n=1 Tax=Orbilia blumenaviensis TaxID=1796055 RepID=A0AAV9UN95_9PEZI
MLQVGSRHQSTWPSPSIFLIDAESNRSLPLSRLQNRSNSCSGVLEFPIPSTPTRSHNQSHFPTGISINRGGAGAVAPLGRMGSMNTSGSGISTSNADIGRYNHHQHHNHSQHQHQHQHHRNSSSSDCNGIISVSGIVNSSSDSNGRRPLIEEQEREDELIAISRSLLQQRHSGNSSNKRDIAKPIQPDNQQPVPVVPAPAPAPAPSAATALSSPLLRSRSSPRFHPSSSAAEEAATLNLPPIRLACSDIRASSSSLSTSTSTSTSPLSPSSSPSSLSSPSSSSSPSLSPSLSAPSPALPSLLPSSEEPQLPSIRRQPPSSPTDNTIATRPARCQSEPSSSPRSPSTSLPSLPGPGLLINPATSVPPFSSSSLPPLLLSLDRVGIDNGSAALDRCLPTLVPITTTTTTIVPPTTIITTTTNPAITTNSCATTSVSSPTSPIESADGRTSRKRNLEEYQGHTEHFSSRRAPASIVHPLSQSQSADSIPNLPPVSDLNTPSLATTDSISVTEEQPSRSPPNPSVNPVPLRLYEGDLANNRPESADNSVETTIVLAHRAVTAIKNSSLPRSKTIGPTFAIGKQGSHPFGVTGRPHDGVVESGDESGTVSAPTNSTTSPSKGTIMMPWDRKPLKNGRGESPILDSNCLDASMDPVPGPVERRDSSPKLPLSSRGMRTLYEVMGNGMQPYPMDTATDSQSPVQAPSDAAGTSNNASGGHTAPAKTTTNPAPQTLSPISRSGDGHPGDGDDDGDPNDKRPRKLSEHEQDNGGDSITSGRAKRRKLGDEEEELGGDVLAEPHVPGKADQDAAVSSHHFGPSKRSSPPPVPSGPPTVESVTSTAATFDSSLAYSEVGTPTTMCGAGSDCYKSPVETTANTLPPIHSPSNLSPSRQAMSPRVTHTLPSVTNLFTIAEKRPIDHQPSQQNHAANGAKYSNPIVVQHLVAAPPAPTQSPASNSQTYIDNYSRAIPYNEPSQQFRAMAPRPRQSPTASPTENRQLAPAPANNFSGQVPTSSLNRLYQPPKNLNRPEHTHLPPIQTQHEMWSGSVTPSDTGSARTPNSKKRARNGTPKPGSIDSSQNSPTIAGGFRCTKDGCTATPFSTQYLLNSHANVHSEDRPHFCPVPGCSRGEGGKGFKRKNEMIRHGLVHQSPGYVCPFCPDKEHRYPRPDNLQRHVKAHHKDKSGDDPLLREVLAVRPEGGQRGRRRRLGPNP